MVRVVEDGMMEMKVSIENTQIVCEEHDKGLIVLKLGRILRSSINRW